jgi:hypothetical protein
LEIKGLKATQKELTFMKGGERVKREVRYRGISNAVRRAIARSEISGEIKIQDVRAKLDASKCSAPEKVIEKSLSYLANNGEIIAGKNGRFFTKDSLKSESTPSAVNKESRSGMLLGAGDSALVSGKITSMSYEEGKVIATVEVKSLDLA